MGDREGQVLLLCTGIGAFSAISRLEPLLANGLQWDALFRRAAGHGLIPALFKQMEAFPYKHIPQGFLHRLSIAHKQITSQNIRTTGEMIRLLNKLKTSGIEAVPYKGAVLESQLYGTAGTRQYDDVDLLIHKKDYSAAREILLGAGYRAQNQFAGRMLEAYLEQECESVFVHTSGTQKVELHWSVLPARFGSVLNLQTISLQEREIKGQENGFPVMSAEYLLLLLCAHNGVKHLWEKLAWQTDLLMLLENGSFDPKELSHAAERFQLTGGLRLARALLEKSVGYQAAEGFTPRVGEDSVMNAMTDNIFELCFRENLPSRPVLGTVFTQYRLLDTPRQKTRFLFSYISPGLYDWNWIELPNSLYWLYYLLRPLRLILKGLKKLRP